MPNINRFGFYAAFIAAVASAGFTIVQLLQVMGVTHYPVDAILIYSFSLCIAPPFVLAVLCLHYSIKAAKRFWTHAALLFSLMYITFVVLMYVVQLAAVIPYNLTNDALIVTPHSLFWTIDALGYISMGIAALFIVPVFEKKGLQRWLRSFFLAHALITPVVALVYFYPSFSVLLLFMASPWSITSAGSLFLLSLYFKRAQSEKPAAKGFPVQ